MADRLGWPSFFLLTTVVTLPALLLLLWLAHRDPAEPAPEFNLSPIHGELTIALRRKSRPDGR